jgi:hypothetical protein
MLLTLENVQSFLAKKKIDAQMQKETGQLYIANTFQGVEFPTFLRVYEGGELLQILLFIPSNIKAGTEKEVARLLNLINKEIDIPGYGMDENSNVIFYRIMIPAFKQQIQEEIIERYLSSLEQLCKTFTPAIVAVSQGHMTYEEILKKLQEADKS